MSGNSKPAIEVAAGILNAADGRVLITRRPEGKDQAGWWEFPGGKIDVNESPLEALKRELNEELGVTVETAVPFMRFLHKYPERQVTLHIFSVGRYTGDPEGCEGQQLRWEKVDALMQAGLLPADLPIVEKLLATAR
ncbi:MAG: 8-oxo-dGTP diphosphatase MutT [Gammaproteobacteria bacterium]|nr:8-oxo-dGTP diphosphatase MutT [Gammaproteobacteria bacterium]